MQAKEEQKFIWLARILVIFVTIGLISNAVLVWTFLKIMPNTKVQPIYIRAKNVDDKDIYVSKNIRNLMGVLPTDEKDLYGMKFEQPGYYMAQNIIKKYIIDRESFIPDSNYENDIWGENSDVRFMSGEKIYKEFITEKSVYSDGRRMNKKTVRFIEAPTVLDEFSNNPEWAATVVIDSIADDGSIVSSAQKRIRAQGYFDTKLFIRNEKAKYKNPLGFVITKYELQ